MEKKLFAYPTDDIERTLKHLQENGAEITQIFPLYVGGGYTDEFHICTNYCICYKSENQIPKWNKYDETEWF